MGLLGFFVRSPKEQEERKAKQEIERKYAEEEKEALRKGRLSYIQKHGYAPGENPNKKAKPSGMFGGFKGFIENANRNVRAGEGGGFTAPHDPFEQTKRVRRGSPGFGFGGFTGGDPFERQAPKPRKVVRKHSGVIIVGGRRYVHVRSR